MVKAIEGKSAKSIHIHCNRLYSELDRPFTCGEVISAGYISAANQAADSKVVCLHTGSQ
jgi:hypothetical protein